MTNKGFPFPQSLPIVDSEGRPTQYFYNYLISNTFTGTVTTAKLTSGGTNGSLVFQFGRIVNAVPAT